MAGELSEVLKSKAIKVNEDNIPEEEIIKRCIPFRWLLIWKPCDAYQDPNSEEQLGVIAGDGMSKAKQESLLSATSTQTCRAEMRRPGRSHCRHHHRHCRDLEGACTCKQWRMTGIHSTQNQLSYKQRPTSRKRDSILGQWLKWQSQWEYLQARLWKSWATCMDLRTRQVFWLDADQKLQKIGGVPHGIDRCCVFFLRQREVGRASSSSRR